MTFRSLWVEIGSKGGKAEDRPCDESACAVLFSLNAFTFPGSLGVFAEQKGVMQTYVDNAWLRVAMDGAALKEFVALGEATEIELHRKADLIDDAHWYLVSDEEF